jgi:diguanylate cyclase (GGDEF)-like protein/PAS domain S-box-containing protein
LNSLFFLKKGNALIKSVTLVVLSTLTSLTLFTGGISASEIIDYSTNINNETTFNTAYNNINLSTQYTLVEKEQAYLALLNTISSENNPKYNALLAYQLEYLAIKKNNHEKIALWQRAFTDNTKLISAKNSLAALALLKSRNTAFIQLKKEHHVLIISQLDHLLNQNDPLPNNGENSIRNGQVFITPNDIAELNNLLASSYYSIGNYTLANKLFIQSMEIYEKNRNEYGIARSLNNLSLIYWAQKDDLTALAYQKKSLEISKHFGDLSLYLTNLSNQGIYYSNLNQVDNAIASYLKVINHEKIANYPKSKINSLIALANAYKDTNELALSEQAVNELLKLSIKSNDLKSQARAKSIQGDIYLTKGQYKKARVLIHEALLYYQKNNLTRLEAQAYSGLSNIYQAENNWKEAFQYNEKFYLLMTKLNNDAQQDSVTKLQALYKTKADKKKITLLKAENTLNHLKIDAAYKQRIIIITLSISILIILFLAFSRYYSRKAELHLQQHNAEIKANEKQLLLLSLAFKNTSDAVWITNENFVIEAVNNAYVTHTHKNKHSVIGKKVGFAEINGQQANFAEKLKTQAMVNGAWHGEIYDKKSSGEIYPLELEIEAITDENDNIIHYLGVFRDITEKIKTQEQLSKLATHDDLTGLPNRALLHELITQSTLNSLRSQKSPAVLIVDVNNFKKINDAFGHNQGDEVIQEIAIRLSNTLYSKDIIGRISGAEFCILVELSDPKYGAAAVARKILSCFESPFELSEKVFTLTASIGITLFPDDAEEAQELLKKAGLALLDIKANETNDYTFFEKNMNNEVSVQLSQEQDIINAINNDEFDFFYQPIVNSVTGKITGAEALIRWIKPDGSVIYPDQFIPFAEKSGLIDKIDEVTIEKVFKQMAIWQKNSLALGSIAINLSAQTFSQSTQLITLLKEKIEHYQISPLSIKIEITEGMLLKEIDAAIDTMQQLKQLGFKLALDDFGTGFSSLSYLKKFPIDVLKVDRSFITDMHESDTDQSIVRSIIDLAHNLNLSVVAEGVELEEHLDILKELNCQEYQGYYYSKPVDLLCFEAMFAKQNQSVNMSNA